MLRFLIFVALVGSIKCYQPIYHHFSRMRCWNLYVYDPENKLEQSQKAIEKLFVRTSAIVTSTIALTRVLRPPTSRADLYIPPTPSRGFQTKSGLRYFDLYVNPSYTQTPKYGQLVSFHYTMYYVPYDRKGNPSKFEIIDSSHYDREPYIHKHGNNQIIRGIDEALHTMRLGSRRRVYIPKSLAYVESGIGPLPRTTARRRKLNKCLKEYEQGNGDFVVDLELMLIADDEADPGYYEDIPVDVEETRQAVMKSMESNRENNQLLQDLFGGSNDDANVNQGLSRESKDTMRKQNEPLNEK